MSKANSDGNEAPLNGDDTVDSPYFTNASAAARKKKLPEWLDHFNAKDLKILFKCSLAVWIATIFIFIDPVLSALGQATFFGW